MKNLPPWTQADATELRAYLSENPKFLQWLRAKRPKLGGDTNELAAMNAKRAEGAEEIVAAIETLSEARAEDLALPQFIDTATD